LFFSWICFLFVFYSALKFKNFFCRVLLFNSSWFVVWLLLCYYWDLLCYCLAFLKFLLGFYYIVVWLLGYYSTFLGLLFRANILNFLLLFNTSNIIIWPNVIQLISKLKVPFWLSSYVWLLLLALYFGFSCDVAYQLNIAPHLFCANLGMKNLDPIHQVTFSIISNMIYKLYFQQFFVFLFGC
jgi:hypothetical protein